MDKSLDGQTVLIFGGSGQMGSAIARASALQGAKLTLVGRELASVQAIAATLNTEKTCLTTDLNSPAATKQLFASLTLVNHFVIAVSANVHASSLTETAVLDVDSGERLGTWPEEGAAERKDCHRSQ